jgi:hypothetical protein
MVGIERECGGKIGDGFVLFAGHLTGDPAPIPRLPALGLKPDGFAVIGGSVEPADIWGIPPSSMSGDEPFPIDVPAGLVATA